MQKEILKPPEVAKILGISSQSVREHIRHGVWTFGECIPKEKTGKSTDTFNIYRTKLEKHIQRRITDEELEN